MVLDFSWPSPYGLFLGLVSVLVGQVVVFLYYYLRREVLHSSNFVQVFFLSFFFCFKNFSLRFQVKQQAPQSLWLDLAAHVSAPESFLLVFGYLSFVWMFRLLPNSYYDLSGSISLWQLLLQFLVTDLFTYCMHRLEHAWPALYVRSHKPHHVWISPKMFNAFNGSVPDTISLILIPLFLTHQVCRSVNNWTFVAFGTLYATQFTLIHCEFHHPWDFIFKMMGIGTAEDHSMHHALVTCNYGHFFTIYDRILGTYRDGRTSNKMTSSHMK
jgi:sterol desaturase/sphingolipid hydroxylase (fatty acid hydroxylase superfamily)